MRIGEFYLTDDILLGSEPAAKVLLRIAEQDMKKPVHKRRVLDLGKAVTHDIPTDCFADDDTIVFLAEGQERARKYGLFVRNAFGENSIPYSKVYMQDLIGKNKSKGFALDSLVAGYLSDFLCRSRGLFYGGSVFGGIECAEGATRKIKGSELEAVVIQALKKKQPFKYNGTLFVPVRRGISLKQ